MEDVNADEKCVLVAASPNYILLEIQARSAFTILGADMPADL